MDPALNQFNRIAWLYDPLVSLVFGQSVQASQMAYLNRVPPRAKILILGGGTGKILEFLFQLNESCEVYYVEASLSMIRLAEKKTKKLKASNVHFIHGTENSISHAVQFDVVITNFFLDMFSPPHLDTLIRQVKSKLVQKGIWIVTDFVDTGKWKHRILLRTMYFFFTTFAGIESKQLPAWENKMKTLGLQEMDSGLFFGGFIKTVLYRIRRQDAKSCIPGESVYD